MSYRSTKCTTEELIAYKAEVTGWLTANFPQWATKYKLRAFKSYDGDVRLYDGTSMEMPNTKSSFRRGEAVKNDEGHIVQYNGTRGHHTTKISNYLTINRGEWQTIKDCFKAKKGDEYRFNEEYLFRHLSP